MKMALAILQGKGEPWADQAAQDYKKKISAFLTFDEIIVKSKSAERDEAQKKLEFEGQALLKMVADSDLLVLFDERGREFKGSRPFSEYILKKLASGKSRVVFAIGGPYGFSKDVHERADDTIRLSNMTFNHHVARVAALEQLYRALAIWKNLPYHND